MTMKHKASAGSPLLKAEGDTGKATVAFAQLNVVDHDGDYTLPGAFTTGEQVKICQMGHKQGELPAGVGVIVGEKEIGGSLWAIADIEFLTETPQGKATYDTVKALAARGYTQEWSYGYDTIAQAPGQVDGQNVNLLQKQFVHELSPVHRGAGIGTHTIDVKAADGACATCGHATKSTTVVQQFITPPDPAQLDLESGDIEAAQTAAVAKGRAVEALAQFELTRAKTLGVPIE